MGQNDDMTILSPDPGDSDKYNQVPKEEPAGSSFQEAPKFETPPVYSEPPRPTEVPVYGEVVEPPKKNNKTLWIIIAVVVAVLCLCCIVTVLIAVNLYNNLDINNFNDFMNGAMRFLKFAPALI